MPSTNPGAEARKQETVGSRMWRWKKRLGRLGYVLGNLLTLIGIFIVTYCVLHDLYDRAAVAVLDHHLD